jgi:hypothetical protein
MVTIIIIWILMWLINALITECDTNKELIMMFFVWPIFDIVCIIVIFCILCYNIYKYIKEKICLKNFIE